MSEQHGGAHRAGEQQEGGSQHGEGGQEGDGSKPGRFEMGGVAKHALIYALGSILSRAISFVMLPIYTRYLTPADYGVMGLIVMTLDFISIVAGGQIALAVFRFYHKTDDPVEKDTVVSTAFIVLVTSYVLVGLGSFLAADFLSDLLFPGANHGDLVRWAAAALACQSLIFVPLTYARVQDRSGLFVAANLVRLITGLTGNIALVVFAGMGVKGVFISALISNIITGGWLTTWLIRDVGVRLSTNTLKQLARYGIPMVGMQFATFLATFGDRYFLQASAGEAEVGLYNLAYQFGFLLAMLGAMAFEQVWAPKRFEVARRPDSDEILSNAFVYSSAWLFIVAVGMNLFIGDIFRVMTQPEFFPAARLVPIIVVAYILQAWSTQHDIGVLIKERTEFLTLANWIAAVVAIASYALLIPLLGALGAACGTILAFGTRWVLTYRYSQRLWRVEYRWSPVVRMALISVAFVGTGILIPELPILTSMALHTAMFGLFLLVGWYGGVLQPEEKASAKALTRKGIARVRALRRRSGPPAN